MPTHWKKYYSKEGKALLAAKRIAREQRNNTIILLYSNGYLYGTEIAQKLGVDKQLVYDVLKKYKIERTKRVKQRFKEQSFICDFPTDYANSQQVLQIGNLLVATHIEREYIKKMEKKEAPIVIDGFEIGRAHV